MPASPCRRRSGSSACAVSSWLPHRRKWSVLHASIWAKTYDASSVALAKLLGCRLVTRDARLRRGTARLGIVVGPAEL